MNQLEDLRRNICTIDAEIIALIAKRQQLALQVGRYKRQYNIPVFDHGREALLRDFHAEVCVKHQLAWPLASKIFNILIEESRKVQQNEQ